MSRTTITIEGKQVSIGDWVGFKSDTEQNGKIIKISGSRVLLENKNGFHGDYIGGDETYWEDANRCWVD